MKTSNAHHRRRDEKSGTNMQRNRTWEKENKLALHATTMLREKPRYHMYISQESIYRKTENRPNLWWSQKLL